MIKSVLNTLFILEFTFFYFFIQGIREYSTVTKWWWVFVILLFSIISLYAQLFRVACMQWEHKYIYQKQLNYTVIVFLFIIFLIAFQRETFSKFILENVIFESFLYKLIGFVSMAILVYWWRKLVYYVIKYA